MRSIILRQCAADWMSPVSSTVASGLLDEALGLLRVVVFLEIGDQDIGALADKAIATARPMRCRRRWSQRVCRELAGT
jgi:hypothetical protein